MRNVVFSQRIWLPCLVTHKYSLDDVVVHTSLPAASPGCDKAWRIVPLSSQTELCNDLKIKKRLPGKAR